jgi:hypothetical protein
MILLEVSDDYVQLGRSAPDLLFLVSLQLLPHLAHINKRTTWSYECRRRRSSVGVGSVIDGPLQSRGGSRRESGTLSESPD